MMEAGIEEARKDLGGIVDRARWKGEPAVITRTGKPAAVIVPTDFCEHVQAAIGEGERDGSQGTETSARRG